MKQIKCICQLFGKISEKVCPHCGGTGARLIDDEPKRVSYVETCIEHAYGTVYRLPFQIRVF